MTTKIKSTSLEDNAVTTAKIASDAVTAAKIPANAIGNSELDLTASYAFSGTISGAGSVERISTGSAGSGVSLLEIDLPTDSKYQHFQFNIHDIYFSADTDLATMFRVQTSGSYSASYTYSTMERTYGASPSGASNNAGSGNAQMSYYNIGNAAVEAASYNIIITNNKTASYHTKYFYTAYGLSASAQATVRTGGGSVHALEINDRFKLYPLSGTMTHGEYALYGFLRS